MTLLPPAILRTTRAPTAASAVRPRRHAWYTRHSGPRVTALAVTITVCVATCQPLQAQTPADTTSARDIERAIENIDAEEGDATQIVEILTDLLENPLDINSASADELAVVPAVGILLAQRIVDFREANGLFGSIPELQLVDGVTEDVFLEARPYLRIGPELSIPDARGSRFPASPSFGQIAGGMRVDAIQRVTRRLDLGRGYDDPDSAQTRTLYAGSPERVYTRIKATYRRNVSLNLTMEKDPGEILKWDPDSSLYGYDHVTAHAAISGFGRIKSLIVGDFVAEFGQGLLFWRGLASGKGRETVGPPVRSGAGLRPYGSTEENRFLRGVAGTLLLSPSVAVSAFASRRSLDASVVEADTSDGLLSNFGSDIGVASVSSSGLHRTPTEVARRDALNETLFGGHIGYTGSSVRLGAVGYTATFDPPLLPGDQTYERFDLAGETVTFVSLFGTAFVSDYLLFGEVASNTDGATAAAGGVSANLGRAARAVVSARYFPKDFDSPHAFAFGERNGTTQNESGIYTGLQLRPSRRIRIAGYFDQYWFPWSRFGVARPTRGNEALLVFEHRPRRWLSYYVQAKTETKEAGDLVTDDFRILNGVREETRQSVRAHGEYQFSKRLTVRGRVEGTRFFEAGEPSEYGLLIYQDIRWVPWSPLRLDGRLMMFDTDSFNARVFAYEYDLRYTFSIPAFSGQGQRAYVMASWAPTPDVTIQIKYGVTRIERVTSVGSGLDETEGNRLRELRMQLFWRF